MSNSEIVDAARAKRRAEIRERINNESDLKYLDIFESAYSKLLGNEQSKPRQPDYRALDQVEDLQPILAMGGMASGNEGTGLTYEDEKERAQLTMMHSAFMIALRIPRTNELSWVKLAVTKYYEFLHKYPDTTGRLTSDDEKRVANMWGLPLPPRPSYKPT